ncbi:hypothetical protein D3C76_1795330 [compost metagenome]
MQRVQFNASRLQPWCLATFSGSSQAYSATSPRATSGVSRFSARSTSRELEVTVTLSSSP